jgi:hypothetical protein
VWSGRSFGADSPRRYQARAWCHSKSICGGDDNDGGCASAVVVQGKREKALVAMMFLFDWFYSVLATLGLWQEAKIFQDWISNNITCMFRFSLFLLVQDFNGLHQFHPLNSDFFGLHFYGQQSAQSNPGCHSSRILGSPLSLGCLYSSRDVLDPVITLYGS